MKLMTETNILTMPMRYLDVGHGLVLNGTYYDGVYFRPQSLSNVNIPTTIWGTQSKFNVYNYVLNTPASGTIPTPSGTYYPTWNYQSESVIQDLEDPNKYYVLRDTPINSTDAGVVSRKNGNDIEIIDTTGLTSIYQYKNLNIYVLKQTDTYLFWVKTWTAPSANNYFCFSSRVYCYNKLTKTTTLIPYPTGEQINSDFIQSYSSTYPGCMAQLPSVVYDDEFQTILSIQSCMQWANGSSGVWVAGHYLKYIKLDKGTRSISAYPLPTPSSGTIASIVQTTGAVATISGKYYVIGYGSYGVEHTDGKTYTFQVHTPSYTDATLPRTVYMTGFDKTNLTTYASCDPMTIDWGESGETTLPKRSAQFTNTASYPANTIMDIEHGYYNTFTTKGNDGKFYLNVSFLDTEPNTQVMMMTFLIDFENKTLTYKNKTTFVNNILFNILFIDNMRYGGNNQKFLTNNGSGYFVYTFNETTFKWDIATQKIYIYTSHSLDNQGNLIHAAGSNTNTGEIYIDSLSGNVSIDWSYEQTKYVYTGTPITSYINARAFNYLNEQIAQEVEFTITGPAKWVSTGSNKITVTTNLVGMLQIPFVTTSNSGQIGVYAKPITGFGG